MKKYRWILELLLIIVLFFGIRACQLRDTASGPAPAINAQLLSGETVELSALRGKPALVFFWASWCPVCEFTTPTVNELAASHQVVSVAFRSGNSEQVQDYLQKQGLSLPVLIDEHGELGQRYGVQAVPISFVLDKQGEIRFVEPGVITSWGLRFRLWLADWF